MTQSPDPQSARTFSAFIRTIRRDLATIWRRLSLPLRISAVLAIVTALILLAFALIGPTSMRLGAAIGLIGLLIAMQVTIMLLLISGQLIPTPRVDRQLATKGLEYLRAGEFGAAVAAYQTAEAGGVPFSAIAALHALAAYFNDDQAEAAAVIREGMRALPADPSRIWLTAVLCIICLIPPPGSESERTLYDIIAANVEGRSAWQAEADHYQGTAYGHDLLMLLEQVDNRLTGRT